MTMSRLTHHISHQFDKELEDIRSKVLAMGGLVEEHIHKVLECFAKGDFDEAEYVAVNDFKVNALEVEIDDDCTEILLRRQPAATDLRLVLSVSKTITDLERIGDLVKNNAKRMLASRSQPQLPPGAASLELMNTRVGEQLARTLQSLERRDDALAQEVWRRDVEIDTLQTALFRELLTYMMEDPRNIGHCTHLLFCARNLERMGDHATNIVEQVHYIVTGQNMPIDRPKGDASNLPEGGS